jgi:CRP/FNR family transcriptional regulator
MTVQEHASSGEYGVFAERKQFALTEVEQREIVQLGRRIDFLAKTTVFNEGEPKVAVYKLTRGTAVRYKTRADGRKHIVGFALPGDFLNSAFADQHRCSVDVIGQATASQFPTTVADFPRSASENPARVARSLFPRDRCYL